MMTPEGHVSTAVIFDYTDAYSVFDWGRMPDELAGKGASLAIIAADWFEKLERPETWKEFLKSEGAQALKRGNRFGSKFDELGEKLAAVSAAGFDGVELFEPDLIAAPLAPEEVRRRLAGFGYQ